MRLAVLRGQTMQHRLPHTPPGEVVGRALDADRFVRYADRWVDLVNGLGVVVSTARARFGRSLVSALESARTVKLAAATPYVHRHLNQVDSGRVDAAVREHRVQALLDGLPIVLVQCGVVVVGWLVFLLGGWDLSSALLVTMAVGGFDWFGRVAGAVITEAPGTRARAAETSGLAGGVNLVALPPGVDLVRGKAPLPEAPP